MYTIHIHTISYEYVQFAINLQTSYKQKEKLPPVILVILI